MKTFIALVLLIICSVIMGVGLAIGQEIYEEYQIKKVLDQTFKQHDN